MSLSSFDVPHPLLDHFADVFHLGLFILSMVFLFFFDEGFKFIIFSVVRLLLPIWDVFLSCFFAAAAAAACLSVSLFQVLHTFLQYHGSLPMIREVLLVRLSPLFVTHRELF